MVGISDLPDEILLMPWYHIEVDDVYNFSTASRRIYLLSCELLPEHCDLKRRISTISNRGSKTGVFARVLNEILLNPRAALYPSVLDIDNSHTEWEDDDPSVPKKYRHLSLRDLDFNLLRRALRATGLLKDTEIGNWIKSITKGDEHPLIASLLILLPNLTSLNYSSFVFSEPCIFQALCIITDSCNHSGPLKRLREVQCDYLNVKDYNDYGDLELIRSIARLPSIQSICGQGLVADIDNTFVTGWRTLPSSKITTLKLTNSAIDIKTLSEFLYTTHRLEHFTYSPFDSNSHPEYFDPFRIRTSLQQNARKTLKTLSLL